VIPIECKCRCGCGCNCNFSNCGCNCSCSCGCSCGCSCKCHCDSSRRCDCIRSCNSDCSCSWNSDCNCSYNVGIDAKGICSIYVAHDTLLMRLLFCAGVLDAGSKACSRVLRPIKRGVYRCRGCWSEISHGRNPCKACRGLGSDLQTDGLRYYDNVGDIVMDQPMLLHCGVGLCGMGGCWALGFACSPLAGS